jgi:ADP-heptose:LPS heptosyltransferase
VKRILVIRLGALGDFVLSFSAFAAIRAHHPGAMITLLTTEPFALVAVESPWFDRVLIDRRPGWFDLPGLARLRQQLRGYDFVYDLQTSRRSSRYWWLAGRPPWSGIARFASHRHTDPRRNSLHTIERQRGQLAVAGIHDVARPDLSWLARHGPVLPSPYALLIPGSSDAHRGAKRWPPLRYADLARTLAGHGLTPVVCGGAVESPIGALIRRTCPEALDLTGRTTIQELAGLAGRARLAVGGDTGPLHLAAAMGCPVVALFSRFSDPALAAPRGARVAVLQEADLSDLSVERVARALP